MDTTTRARTQDHQLGSAQSTMSESITRRSSSRQLLQNLIRVTAQRSQEDAEEVERERRRRAREKKREEGSASCSEPPQHNNLTHNKEFDEEMKPCSFLVLEEDEGFSDWSHRLENRLEQEDCRAQERRPSAPQRKPEAGEEKQQEEEEEEGEREPEQRSKSQEPSPRFPEKMSGIRKEVRASYSSSVFLPQDNRLQHAKGQPADRTSYLVAGTMKPRGAACRVDGEVEQEEQKQVKEVVQYNMEEEDDSEEDELSCPQEENEGLHLERERHKEEEEEEKKDRMAEKRSVESGDGRSEDVSSSAAPLCCSEAEEQLNCYGPMSPTFKKLLIQFYPDEVNSRVSTDGKYTIIERTESLRKSTNSTKKTMPPAAVSKINKKLEEYTHALEGCSKDGRSGCQVLTDLTNPSEPVAYKKNLFEAREAWNQNPVSVPPSKDADGLKVGVADLINQWVRGSEDGSRCSSPSKPAESATGKRYKFVVTGHGKYEKVSADHSCSEDINCQSAGLFCENERT